MDETKEPKFTRFDKVLCAVGGPILGWLPPRVQRDMVIDTDGFGYERAKRLSASSRTANALFGLYAIGAGVAKHFGADIDPTNGDYLTLAGLVVATDTAVRELCRGATIAYHGDSAAGDIWGSPLASTIDRVVNSKAYDADRIARLP